MTREELKHLWFNLPRVKPQKEIKAIVITRHGDNHYSCERQTQTQEYWASSSSNFKTYEEALDRANTMLDSEIHEGYELIIN